MSDNIELVSIEEKMSQNYELLSQSSLAEINILFLEPFSSNYSTDLDFVIPEIVSMPQHSNIFVTLKKEKNKKGRKRKNKKHYIIDGSIHTKFVSDNLLTKIQVNYFTFIVDFSNELLKFMGIKGKFYKISYAYKRKTNKEFISILKGMNIGQILLLEVSPKYLNKDNNKNLYNIINKNPIINSLLSQNYLAIFQNIYYKSERIINMEKYGLNKNFVLSNKVKMYDDFILKMKDRYGYGTNDCKEYIISLNRCVEINFL